jgi:hypothetical protein
VKLNPTILLAAVIVLAASASAEERTSVADSGETVLRATVGGRTVRALIRTQRKRVKVSPGETDTTAPERSLVQRIEIIVNGDRIVVPNSAMYGLVSPLEASLRVASPLSVLTIVGGDTSESYVVKIEFDSKRVRRKIVASGIMPDKPTEITTYHLHILKDD